MRARSFDALDYNSIHFGGLIKMTDEELNEIEARANAATPAPWRWGCWETNFFSQEPAEITKRNTLEHLPSMLQFSAGVRKPEDDSKLVLQASPDYDAPSFEDRMFIAHARTDIPALIAEVRRLRGSLAYEGR